MPATPRRRSPAAQSSRAGSRRSCWQSFTRRPVERVAHPVARWRKRWRPQATVSTTGRRCVVSRTSASTSACLSAGSASVRRPSSDVEEMTVAIAPMRGGPGGRARPQRLVDRGGGGGGGGGDAALRRRRRPSECSAASPRSRRRNSCARTCLVARGPHRHARGYAVYDLDDDAEDEGGHRGRPTRGARKFQILRIRARPTRSGRCVGRRFPGGGRREPDGTVGSARVRVTAARRGAPLLRRRGPAPRASRAGNSKFGGLPTAAAGRDGARGRAAAAPRAAAARRPARAQRPARAVGATAAAAAASAAGRGARLGVPGVRLVRARARQRRGPRARRARGRCARRRSGSERRGQRVVADVNARVADAAAEQAGRQGEARCRPPRRRRRRRRGLRARERAAGVARSTTAPSAARGAEWAYKLWA